ncbi:hypothetical protein NC653_007770 [Populus alba x Populus x berolinensis]|uniref:Plant heme peroxidase family profile domain-containing protein n=1 Tax=Populus alba x Populus x berolinensis TaxID=444605 RepID=A0AAD6W878_9ROSI|nr:hypothetical protein NC653_007770 [Populus alba x Populus x berolinensis]
MRGSPSSSTAQSPCLKGSISSPPSSSASFEDSLLFTLEEQGMNMAYEGPGLMAGVETRIWVRAYASDISLFLRDYVLAMMKLSNLRVLTGSTGQVRLHCSKVTRKIKTAEGSSRLPRDKDSRAEGKVTHSALSFRLSLQETSY